MALFVLLLPLVLSVLEVEVNRTIHCSVEFKSFVKDIEWYVILGVLISILFCYAVELPTCDRYALYLYSGMDILSSCFLCLVEDAPALLVCCAFVATATILPGVNPLETGVPPQSRCHTSTAVST